MSRAQQTTGSIHEHPRDLGVIHNRRATGLEVQFKAPTQGSHHLQSSLYLNPEHPLGFGVPEADAAL